MSLWIFLLSVTALFTNTTLVPGFTAYGTLYQGEDLKIPTINDDSLRIELVSIGLEFPSSMAFLDSKDILVLEKNEGTVKRIKNSDILEEPVLDENVANKAERGMAGIAISEQSGRTNVFLYFTEAKEEDGDDPTGNRLYKYQFVDGALVDRRLLLDLPATPGPYHNGGALTIGPDNNLYLPIGDVDDILDKEHPNTLAENGNEELDGRSGILRVTQQGEAVEAQDNGDEEDDDGENEGKDENDENENEEGNSINGILGEGDPLNKYYAYGIRNSFGIDFDPVSGSLWDTENGPNYGDEINLVEPGFNSGWNKVQGFWEDDGGNMGDAVQSDPEGLVSLQGKGKYSPPELTWKNRIGPTALKFLDSERLGVKYRNDMFVSDYHGGNIYHFDLEGTRTELSLSEPLRDRIVDNLGEIEQHIFGQGFGAITDMEVGPDGYLYILSKFHGSENCDDLAFAELCIPDSSKNGVLFRIVPNTT